MKGEPLVLSKLKLGTYMPAAALLKELSQIPPLTLLQLCYKGKNFNLSEHLLQHADDLDFVQDTITATGKCSQLNPVMNGVLAAFNRRRRFNRFKYGNVNLEFDRLRFANTATESDGDHHATEVKGNKNKKENRGGKGSYYSGAVCRFYQREPGCFRRKCVYAHRCIICNKAGHGAVTCSSSQENNEDRSPRPTRSRERPPDPRTRRARAN